MPIGGRPVSRREPAVDLFSDEAGPAAATENGGSRIRWFPAEGTIPTPNVELHVRP